MGYKQKKKTQCFLNTIRLSIFFIFIRLSFPKLDGLKREHRGDSTYLIGDIKLPEEEEDRLLDNIESSFEDFIQPLSREFIQPALGTPLYDYKWRIHERIDLDYFDARNKAISMANHALDRMDEFYIELYEEKFSDLAKIITMHCNSHINDLKDNIELQDAIAKKCWSFTELFRKYSDPNSLPIVMSDLDYVSTLTKIYTHPGSPNFYHVNEFKIISKVAIMFSNSINNILDGILDDIVAIVQRKEYIEHKLDSG